MTAPEDTCRVSVVIPVYNTGEYLLPGLRSLEEQDLPAQDFEVVAVDDGSTDGSGELLDAWAAEHPNVHVLHQPNSGWPGQPRNRGVDASRGTYVFFLDADDYLGTEALRRLADYADEHGSDIVVPRMEGVGGRWFTDQAWSRPSPDAHLEDVFVTLSPQKLFRRSFLREQGLRFPEGKVRLEDGILLARAYLTASRVSSVGDYTYYYLRQRETGGNISSGALDPVGYTESIRTIGLTVRELCRDPALADRIVLDLYRRKGLKVFAADRFLKYSPARRQAWTEAVRELARDLVPPGLEEQLPEPYRTRSALARAGDVDGQVAFALAYSSSGPPVPASRPRALLNRLGLQGPGQPLRSSRVRLVGEVRQLAWLPTGLAVEGRARLRERSPVHLRLDLVLARRRDPDGAPLVLPVRSTRLDGTGTQGWRTVLPHGQLSALPRGTYDLSLQTRGRELQHRLAGPVDLALPEARDVVDRRITVYVTQRGNLSLRVGPRG